VTRERPSVRAGAGGALAALVLLTVLVLAGCGPRASKSGRAAQSTPREAPATVREEAPSEPTPAAVVRPAVARGPTPVRPLEMDSAVAARRLALIAQGRVLAATDAGYFVDVQEARLRQLSSDGLRVERDGQRLVLQLAARFAFSVGSAELSVPATGLVERIAGVLADYALSVVSVHGHTDSTGDAVVNQRLSEQRALVVAGILHREGVVVERLLVAGHGATDSLASNATPEGREANRRVTLRVVPLVNSGLP